MWFVICGRRIPAAAILVAGWFGALLLAAALGWDVRVSGFLLGFGIVIVVLNALSGRSRQKPP